MIMSHVSCFIQGEVIGFQVLLDSLHPRIIRVRGCPGGLQFCKEKAVKILASDICAMRPNGRKCCACT